MKYDLLPDLVRVVDAVVIEVVQLVLQGLVFLKRRSSEDGYVFDRLAQLTQRRALERELHYTCPMRSVATGEEHISLFVMHQFKKECSSDFNC